MVKIILNLICGKHDQEIEFKINLDDYDQTMNKLDDIGIYIADFYRFFGKEE